MQDLPVNITDLIVILVILGSGLLAFLRGFFKEVFSIGSWVGAIFASLYGLEYVRPFARDLIPAETVADLAAGAGLFIGSLIFLSIVSHYLAQALQARSLSAIDCSLGFLFGLLRGAILVCLAFLVIQWAIEEANYPPWLKEAKTLPLARQGSESLLSLVPEHYRSDADRAASEAKRKAEEEFRRRSLRALTEPTPTGGAKSGATNGSTGDTDKERQDMNRTIQKTQ